jgi:predicted nucleotidyltransferase
MDIYNDSLLLFWQSLNKNQVSYIMVGGFAVNMHGYMRATKDADMWIKDSLQNRQNLRKSFLELGYGDYESLETMQFVPGWSEFYIGDGIVLDIMTGMKGLDGYSFEDSLQKASVADLGGIMVPFLHINQLLANKKAVSRPKDQLDVIELEKIKEERRKMGLD